MRDSRWRRNGMLALFALGVAAVAAAIFWPAEGKPGDVRSWVFVAGLMLALVFGIGAWFRQREVRAQGALARGEHVIARWHVDADVWTAFVALDRELNQSAHALVNEFAAGDFSVKTTVEIVIGEDAVQIGDSIYLLPRRGTPEITEVEFNASRTRTSYLEFQLYYPGGGTGASGVPHPARRNVLRFPVAVGADRQAKNVVAVYESTQRAPPDFFHGRGDGSDAEDLNSCWTCGYKTHRFMSHCPQCDSPMQTRRWSRRFGIALSVTGLFIVGVMGAVIYDLAPLLMHPGVRIGHSKFNGSPTMALGVALILGAVFVFGATALGYGVWQVCTGQRSKKVVTVMLAISSILGVVAWTFASWN